MRRQVHRPTVTPSTAGASGACVGAAAGAACGRDHICVNGSCALGCEAGKVLCRGHCIDPLTDAAFWRQRRLHRRQRRRQLPGAARTLRQHDDRAVPGRTLQHRLPQRQKRDFYSPARSRALTLPACVTGSRSKPLARRAVTARAAAWAAAAPPSRTGLRSPARRSRSSLARCRPSRISRRRRWRQLCRPRNYAALCRRGGGGAYQQQRGGGAAMTQAKTGSGTGGQAHNNGGGGGGFTDDGQGSGGFPPSGGHSFLHGGLGGSEYPPAIPTAHRGGFGGGGGASQYSTFNAGGGGGFDGGSSGNGSASTGGSSYITPTPKTLFAPPPTTATAPSRSATSLRLGPPARIPPNPLPSPAWHPKTRPRPQHPRSAKRSPRCRDSEKPTSVPIQPIPKKPHHSLRRAKPRQPGLPQLQ